MPQPISTPTRLGTTASATLIVVPNSASEAKVRVGHDGRVRALRERHVEHAADLLDARVLYVNGVACRRAVFSLDGKHERSFPSNLHAPRSASASAIACRYAHYAFAPTALNQAFPFRIKPYDFAQSVPKLPERIRPGVRPFANEDPLALEPNDQIPAPSV